MRTLKPWSLGRIVVAVPGSGQDQAEVFETATDCILVVADGAGGLAGGDRAARLIVEGIRDWTQTPAPQRTDWSEVLRQLDFRLSRNPKTGESTAVVLQVNEAGICGASVGDSGAWLISDSGEIEELTSDQVRKPLLGSGHASPIRFEKTCWSGTLLVASDGLLKYVPRGRIAELASQGSQQRAVEQLVNAARLRSGALQDDVAILLCRKQLG